MTRDEWYNKQSTVTKERRWYNAVHKLIKKWKKENAITAPCTVHHRDDNDEVKSYNESHYELWGFNEDGSFEYGKYVVFMTRSEHVIHHNSKRELSNETKSKISKSNKGKQAGDKNPMFGRHHTEESKRKMSETKRLPENSKLGVRFTDEHKIHLSEARQRVKELYNQHRKNGGSLSWNQFQKAVANGTK